MTYNLIINKKNEEKIKLKNLNVKKNKKFILLIIYT